MSELNTADEPSRAETTYLAIKHAIIEQALPPGTRLPEDEMGVHLHVSRTLVREALARLTTEGLVEAGRKRTATVAQPTRAEAEHVFSTRHCLEREVVRVLITRWTPAMGAALEGHVRLEEKAQREQPHAVCGRLAGEFHIKLAQLTGNPLLERFVSELVSRCSLILAIHGRPHVSDCAIDEHRQLIAALRQGDEKSAVRLMVHHLEGVHERALLPERQAGDAELGAVLTRYSASLAAPKPVAAPMAAPVVPKTRRVAPRKKAA